MGAPFPPGVAGGYSRQLLTGLIVMDVYGIAAGTSFDEFPRVRVVCLLEHGEGCNGQLVEKANTMGTSGTHINVPVDIYFVNGALQDESGLGTTVQ